MSVGETNMSNIKKLQKERENAVKKLDRVMDSVKTEQFEMVQKINNLKKEFVLRWKDYKNHTITPQEFFEISEIFAGTLEKEIVMYKKIRKIVGPAHTKFVDACEDLSQLEKQCPKCGGMDIARILYGLPLEELLQDKKVKQKKIVLGGCCVTGDDPKLECNDCGWRY